jgi:hypothetical protein
MERRRLDHSILIVQVGRVTTIDEIQRLRQAAAEQERLKDEAKRRDREAMHAEVEAQRAFLASLLPHLQKIADALGLEATGALPDFAGHVVLKLRDQAVEISHSSRDASGTVYLTRYARTGGQWTPVSNSRSMSYFAFRSACDDLLTLLKPELAWFKPS